MNSVELETIKQSFSEKTLQRGEVILREGELSDTLYFVVAGAVKIFKTSSQGKEQILSIARPGEALNDIPVFDGGTNPINAQALGTVKVYSIKKERLQSIMQQYPRVALNTSKVLAQRMRQLVTLVEDLSFRHVLGRVTKGGAADWLQWLAIVGSRACCGSARDTAYASTSITSVSGTTPSSAIASAAAGLCMRAFKASMSGTSMTTATRFGFCGSTKVRILVTPSGPNNSLRFGECNQ